MVTLTALEYAAKGWPVLPLHGIDPDGNCTCHDPGGPGCVPGKHPSCRHGVHDATTDTAVIALQFEGHPHRNIGVRTGEHLVVLDVDPRHGGDDSLHALQRDFDTLPATVKAITGGGGAHYLFDPHGAHDVPNRVGIGSYVGLDFKGENGYFVAVPSLHESGRVYEWATGRAPGQIEIATCPDWLIDLAHVGGHTPRAEYEPVGWTGLEPHWLAGVLKDVDIRRRFGRDPEGLNDRSASGIEMSLVALAAWRFGLDGAQLETLIHCSRAPVGLPRRRESYFRATVGRALASAGHLSRTEVAESRGSHER